MSFEVPEHSHLAGSALEDTQLASPVETGAIPATGSEESWMKEYGHD
jgi:CO dehydrogenase/acetyl-CoA synthase delta subunit